MSKLVPYQTVEFAVSAADKVAVYSDDSCSIYYIVTFANHPSQWTLLANTTAGEQYTSAAFTVGTTVRIVAGSADVEYIANASANIVPDTRVVVSTITSAATLTAAQTQGRCIYQDASGGVVTMTTLTGTLTAAAFPNMAVGDAVSIFHASNHATNTSTLSGGVDVTLIGSGAVTSTGGQYLLIKTAATTFDLVRVG